MDSDQTEHIIDTFKAITVMDGSVEISLKNRQQLAYNVRAMCFILRSVESCIQNTGDSQEIKGIW